jgi:hypothetical protein
MNPNYKIKVNDKLVALAAAGAAQMGLTLDAALLRPIINPVTKEER